MEQPKTNKEFLIALHEDLGTFHSILSRRTIPASTDNEECEVIEEAMEIIEDYVANLKSYE